MTYTNDKTCKIEMYIYRSNDFMCANKNVEFSIGSSRTRAPREFDFVDSGRGARILVFRRPCPIYALTMPCPWTDYVLMLRLFIILNKRTKKIQVNCHSYYMCVATFRWLAGSSELDA